MSVSWWGHWLQLIQTQLLIAKRGTAVKIKRTGGYFRLGSGFLRHPCPAEQQIPLWEEDAEITGANQWEGDEWPCEQTAGLGCPKTGLSSKTKEKISSVLRDSVLSSQQHHKAWLLRFGGEMGAGTCFAEWEVGFLALPSECLVLAEAKWGARIFQDGCKPARSAFGSLPQGQSSHGAQLRVQEAHV